ncbi:glycoside hydrolase [Streptomyces genisteinicus]|uniref:beta-N-acetylhexosaminidase n=2 Tax=Streptomyces genisteinicus TaxID=2768068 RepID=A0A7H0HNT9_9ACTN|nr:glycoside hydrolase [Streptomyces genisteinicus]
MPVMPFPRPRSITVSPGGAPPDAPFTVTADPALPAEGYRLRTGPDGVHLAHADAAGLRYGLATLDQLRASPGFPETGYAVDDHPDFPVRGFLLDISRDRVPTRRTLRRWLEVLSLARFNQLELYTEHTFAFRDHADVWQDASPLTAGDLRWLDAQCAALGIALVANQNTFGHMERFLALDRHRDRAENPDGFVRGGVRHPPSTLAPTPENAAFAQALVAEVADGLRTRRVNIGADEPFELGTGRSRDRAARDGVGAVWLDHVGSLMEPWLAAGWTVQFWADVLVGHPELLGALPDGSVPVVWQYDAPGTARAVLAAAGGEAAGWKAVGADLDALAEGFRSRTRMFREAGREFWVAPGTGTWNSLLGRLDNARENMADAAAAGLEHGATGYLLTCWGDQGMWEPPSPAFGPAVYGGAVAWCLDANRDLDLAPVLDAHVLLDAAGLAGSVLDRLGRLGESLGVPLLNASPLVRVLRPDAAHPVTDHPTEEAMDTAARTLEECRRDLADADLAAADGDTVVRELTHAVALAAFALDLLRAQAHSGGPADTVDAATAARLLRRLDPLLAEQRACWLLRSRPGGLDDSMARFAVVRRLLTAAAGS